MPRRVTSRIHDYFIYEVNKSICQLLNKEGALCNAAIKGRHAGNLEKHVKTWHEDDWSLYWTEKTQLLVPSDDLKASMGIPNTTPHFVNVDLSMIHSQVIEYDPEPPQQQPEVKKRKISPQVVEKDISIREPISPKLSKPSEIEDAIIELVTVNGLPFSIVEESGFKKLAALAYKGSEQGAGPRQIMNRSKIIKMVKSKAESIRRNITELLKNKLICLRIDCAVVDKKHVYGIGVHIRKSSQHLVFSLAVISLPNDHTQDILKEEIFNVLLEVGVQTHQIYHIVVTNCSQALKVTNKTEDADESKTQSAVATSTPSVSKVYTDYTNYDSDFDIFEVEETEYDPEEDRNEMECDDAVSNDEATERIVEEVIECWSVEEHIITARSLVHVFQLSMLDTFAETAEITALLKKIRTIVKKLTTPAYAHQLKSFRCKKKPILDSNYRLLSTYDMLQRLVELKPYLDQLSATIPEIVVPLNEWNLVMDIVDSLKPLKVAIIRLTPKYVPLSEFYKIWITSFLKTKKIGTEFSLRLCKNMDKRKSWLFNNVTFKSCLFLDPRFKNTLNRNDHDEVFAHLVDIYDRMTALQPTVSFTDEEPITPSIKLENPADDEEDELYQYVRSMVKTPLKQQDKQINVQTALKKFKDSEPLLEIEDVPAFWQEKKYLYKEVYKLSQVILSVPPSNVFLEMFTSQLKFISDTSRNSAENRLLKDIILIRSNFDLLNQAPRE
ncbi:uncharacterized protein LOC135839631 isoform X2 [Planococcus citri]|uniref:uncharacterized protein LOC135839631 isoform X2 n=1 Tax=Planococcus citri TaxID=170843 RepID=UPI0031FA3F46